MREKDIQQDMRISEGLIAWWKDYCDADLEQEQTLSPPLLPDINKFLSSRGLKVSNELHEGFSKLNESTRSNDQNAIVAARVIASAVTEALAESDNIWSDIQLALLAFEHNEAFNSALEKRMIEKLGRDNASRSKWIDAIKNGLWNESRAIYSIDKHRLQIIKKTWETCSDPYEVWHERRSYISILSESYYPVLLLLRSSSPEWVEEFERLPLPAIKNSFIHWHENDISEDQILELVRTSEPIYEGNKWNRNTTVLYAPILAMRKIIGREEEAKGEGQERPTTEVNLSEESEYFLKQVFQEILNRPFDGVPIIRALQEWLIAQTQNDFDVQSPQYSKASLEVVTDVLAAVKDARTGGGWLALQGEIILEHTRNATLNEDNEACALWRWFNKLLMDCDEGLLMSVESHKSDNQLNWYAAWSGRCLANLTDPIGKWVNAWGDLDSLRERALHDSLSNRRELMSNIALIEAGCGALSWLYDNEKGNDAHNLWKKLVDAGHYLWLCSSQDISAPSHRTLVRCLAWIAELLPDKRQENLRYFISLVGEDHYLLSHVAWILYNSGTSMEQLYHWFTENDLKLDTVLNGVIRWGSLTGRRDQSALAERSQEILSVLNLPSNLSQ